MSAAAVSRQGKGRARHHEPIEKKFIVISKHGTVPVVPSKTTGASSHYGGIL